MNTFLRFLVIFFIAPLFAQTNASQEMLLKLSDFINHIESKKSSLQGGAVAILHKGHVIYKTTFGYQKGKKGPVTEHTLFPLASVSKPVSAIAIALLVDKGLVDLDEKFQLHCMAHPVNLAHILSHSTGYDFRGDMHIEKGLSRTAMLNILKNELPNNEPGKYYSYSNAIYSLAEEALNLKKLSIEVAIKNLCDVLRTQEIQLSKVDNHKKLAFPHAVKKIKGRHTKVPLQFPPYYPKTVPAAAGVFASINGMIEIFKLCFGYRPDLISQQTLDRMFTPVVENSNFANSPTKWPIDKKNIESHYALGWRINKVKNHPEKDFIFHCSFINGIRSLIGFVPGSDAGIIVLTNQDTKFPLETGATFWGEFINN